ncbi:gasdermin-D-like [Eublepharis macularius]|uniref:Gasdermin-D-like n=1 Tax=Eublepharis macularius TaxID=481883 RepID=A0AA97K5P2_EUBMA|nr:gasdermin-D-like [Eublepharis macularius]
MFKRLAKQLIQELDSEKKLIPLTSLAYAENFRPLSLVTKDQSKLPWHSRKYSPTPFKLADILPEGETMEIELKHSEPLLFSANVCKKSGARLNLKIRSAGMDIGGLGATCLSTSPMSVRKTYVDTRDLWKVKKTSLSLIQQKYPKLQFYVVTEVFEIMEPLLIEEIVQGGGKGEVTAVEIFKIQGLDSRMKRKYLQIPCGTVVAYVVEKLQTPEDNLTLYCLRLRAVSVTSLTYDAFQDELGSSLTAVQQVKDTVKEAYEPLTCLSQALKIHFLEFFGIFLQDGDVASTVQSVLELSLAGDIADRSMLAMLNEDFRPQVETLLSHLGIFQAIKGRESRDLWGPAHFLCSSLDDLDYEIMPLLEATLEKKKIAKHLEIMAGVLEWILSGEEGSVFASPLHSLTDEEADLAAEMLQICGLDSETRKGSIIYLWNNEARSELAALYSSLYALQILSG